MKTVWIAMDEHSEDVEVFAFAESARNCVFEWAKNYLTSNYTYESEEEMMNEANEMVICAEETPWMGIFRIEEKEVRDE